MKLDAKTVAELTLSTGKTDQIFFDDDLPGFGFRIRAGGRRTFVAQYRVHGRTRRQTIGARLNAEEARKAARRILANVELGGDPQGDKARARLKAARTMKAIAADYLVAKKSELRPASYRSAELYLQRGSYFAALYPIAISDIELEDVATCLTAITLNHGRSTAKLARSYLSRMFAWAIGQGLCLANPVLGSNKPQGSMPRERVLNDHELAAIWNAACADDDYSRIVRLLLSTGARREEIGGLRWNEVDLEMATITLPQERVKNKRGHVIPLSPPALAILEQVHRERHQDFGDFVFGAGKMAGFTRWAVSKDKLDSCFGDQMATWRLHDLRRTCATGMADIAVLPHVVEAVLNHYDGHRSGMAGVYNKALYEREKRDALNRWAAHVTDIAAGRDAKVVPLRSG